MQAQDTVLVASLVINFFVLIIYLFQIRYLAEQTKSLNRTLRYSSYQKLVDYLNDINMLIIENKEVAKVFNELDFISDNLQSNKQLSLEKIGLAWLIINRYEAAFVGYQLGIIPEGEWKI